MKFLLLSTLIISTISFAHAHDHDWRTDFDAYLSVQYESPDYSKMMKFYRPKMDMDFFEKNLTTFASVNRQKQSDLDTSRKFLTDQYQKLGFQTELHVFGSGINFVAEKKGTVAPEKVLVLSSHIDSVGNKGANDNGTGTIGLLTVAKELAKKDYPYTIRILGFDREEVGLKGSDTYVAQIQEKKNIIGNINFEMMGYHSKNDGGFHVIDCSRPLLRDIPKPDSLFLSQAVKNSIESLGADLSVVKTCTDRSDHASFWRHNIPAIVISENFFGGDGDPCYHAKCDVVDSRLNYQYMEKILSVTLDATERLLTK